MPSPSGSSGSLKALPRRSPTHSVSIPTLSTVKFGAEAFKHEKPSSQNSPREHRKANSPSPCLPPLPSLSSPCSPHAMQCSSSSPPAPAPAPAPSQPAEIRHRRSGQFPRSSPGAAPIPSPSQARTRTYPGSPARPPRFTAHGIPCTSGLHYHRQLCTGIESQRFFFL